MSCQRFDPSPRTTASSRAVQAELVDVVEVDRRVVDGPRHVVVVTTFRGRDDRCAAEPVEHVVVGLRGRDDLGHPDAPVHAGHQPGRVVAVVQGVRVRTEVDQQPGDGRMVAGGSEQQRGAAVPVSGLEVGSLPERDGCSVGVTGFRGSEQGCVGLGLRQVRPQRAVDRGGDLVVATALRVNEGLDAVALRRHLEIRPARHQCTDRVDVHASPVAEDDRLVQRHPAQVVDVIDVDVGLEQVPDDVGDVLAQRRG